MLTKEQVKGFIKMYNRDFPAEEGFPTLGKVERKGERFYIHVNDLGFEDQEVDWLKDYFNRNYINDYTVDYDDMQPAIILY